MRTDILTMNTGNKILASSVLFFLGAVIFAGSFLLPVMHTASKSSPTDVPPASLNLPPAAIQFSGYVGVVGASSFTLTPSLDASANTKNDITVLVDSHTAIYKQGAKKDAAQYKQEMDEFLQTVRTANQAGVVPTAPDAYERIPLTLKDIKPGMFATVTASETEPATTVHATTVVITLSPTKNINPAP
jgi:hypothetical protein